LTGGSLAVRGGVKAARNSAIMCAVFLAVIEGVGIGFQRMMADNTKLEVCGVLPNYIRHLFHESHRLTGIFNLASSPSALRPEGFCLNTPFFIHFQQPDRSIIFQGKKVANFFDRCLYITPILVSLLRCSGLGSFLHDIA
jgi:hypothetical protein